MKARSRSLERESRCFQVAKTTQLFHLPLEVMDIILQKLYLHWILTSSAKQRDGEVIRFLMSVDVCFYRRITRQRFKKAIWRYLKDNFKKTKKRCAIVRNNKKYLLENIQPNDELIDSLLSLNCITEEQCQFIQSQLSRRDKNAEILHVLRSCDQTKFSNFVKCLQQTNQTTVARIMGNGGVVIEVKIRNRGKTSATSMNLKRFHQEISDLRWCPGSRSHEAEELISQMKDKNLKILNCQLYRNTVVISTWCLSQAAVECIQRLFEENRLMGAGFAANGPCASKSLHSKVIISASNRFNSAVVICPIYVESTERFQVEGTKDVYGVTRLRNEIYIICETLISPSLIIRVYEDRNPFRLQVEIKTKAIKHPVDIVSSEKENCLYVSDNGEWCVWKITRERDDQHKIIKWLSTKFRSSNLSVSSDGQLLVVGVSSSILRIYGPDSELIQSIHVPKDVKELKHAVQTSIGNLIILHTVIEKKKKPMSLFLIEEMTSVVSELSKDGKTLIRRFVHSGERQMLEDPGYLAFDGGDQLFVADSGNGRVIVLDSELKWNGVLCSTRKEGIWSPNSLCYDKDKKQLIVVGIDLYKGCVANVCTLSRQ